MMMTMMYCLSVCNLGTGILWNGRLFQLLQCWLLSSYLSTREFICRTVFASYASASRGTKQRRQLHFQFASYVYEFTTSVRLWYWCVAKRILIIQDAQLSQRDRAAGCVIVFAKSRTLELGDNDLRTL